MSNNQQEGPYYTLMMLTMKKGKYKRLWEMWKNRLSLGSFTSF